MRGVRRARVMYCKPGGQPGGVGVETLEGSPTRISLAGTDDINMSRVDSETFCPGVHFPKASLANFGRKFH